MKTLYIIRHAKSSWEEADILADIERPLNERGKRDAPFMGKLLGAKAIQPDVLVSSPATRAFKTAKLIAEEIQYKKKDILIHAEIYEATPEKLLDIIQSFSDQWNTVFLFGHNPTMTELVNWYTEVPIDNMPTCGIAGIEFNVQHWEEATSTNGKVFLFEFPKKYLPGMNE